MNPTPRSAAATLAAAVFLFLHPGCAQEQPAEAPIDEVDSTLVAGKRTPKPEVVLDVEVGRIELELFPDVAPLHVAQFLDLVSEGFYDGTTFHRVVPGYLIQAGDPNSKDDDPSNDGYGGLEDRRLPLEIDDRLAFRRGTLGMARDYRPDGASTQFFITLGRASHLDGEYTIFGRVIGGFDVVDYIAGVEVDEGRHPTEPIPILAMRVKSDPRPGGVTPAVIGAAPDPGELPPPLDPIPEAASTPSDFDAIFEQDAPHSVEERDGGDAPGDRVKPGDGGDDR